MRTHSTHFLTPLATRQDLLEREQFQQTRISRNPISKEATLARRRSQKSRTTSLTRDITRRVCFQDESVEEKRQCYESSELQQVYKVRNTSIIEYDYLHCSCVSIRKQQELASSAPRRSNKSKDIDVPLLYEGAREAR